MPGDLLAKLPAFKGEEVVLVNDQSIPDIIKGVLSRHDLYASDYDKIAGDFDGGDEIDISKRLFDYVKCSFPYEIESSERQTVRSPSALVAMSDYWGGDCKHYASFIGGVLDAINRKTGMAINWCYRFAGYNILDKKNLGHVFIVINPNSGDGITDNETWVDPVLDEFNTRKPWPWYVEDKRPKIAMSLVQISGVQEINTMVIAQRNRAKALGDISIAPPTGGPSITDPTLSTSTGGDSSLAVTALNVIAPGAGSAAQSVINFLPNGDLKNFLNSFLQNPTQALEQLIKGRTYTSGDYELGELYMRNILGMENIQSEKQVTDPYIPQAWLFFSAAVGVRIRTFDDMDTITGASASPPATRAAAYLQRNPTETPDISMAAATRAAQIFGDTSVSKFNMWNNRDVKWNLQIFNSYPYVYPIPGAVENQNFTGVHPILGTTFSNGYPVDYTGPRYVSQNSQTLQSGVTITPQPSATAAAGTAATGLASILGANPVTALLLIGGAGLLLTQLGKSKPHVSGTGKNTVWYLAGGAVILYLLYKNSSTSSTPPITTTPVGPTVPAVVTPVSGGGSAPIVIAPPSGGPGASVNPGQVIIPPQLPIDPGAGAGGGGIDNEVTTAPALLSIDPSGGSGQYYSY